MRTIVERVLRVGQGGGTTAVAIVTRIEGSAYRRPGAKLLIDGQAGVLGGVSGGCLEEDVRLVGLKVRESGRTRTLHYDTGGDDSKLWGLGLGCDGHVDVLVSPIRPDEASRTWTPIRNELQGDSPFALASIVEDQGMGGMLVVGRSGRIAGSVGDPSVDKEVESVASATLDAGKTKLTTLGSRQIFTEVLVPPPKLLVCGAGEDARPLVEFAAAVGFRVFVVDHRPAHLAAPSFPAAQKLLQLRPDESSLELPADRTTFVVVKTHALKHDAAWVKRLMGTDVPYIGVLGPRTRIKKILDGLAVGSDERVFGPVGIDVGADGPEQVALSIVAEVLAVWSNRTPRHLRELAGALHASA
jgi:xanthine dehydrogenase accessory factor